MFVIIAAMVTFAGCAKEEISAPEAQTVHFFAESIETKTAFGTPDGTTYPTLWTGNDSKVHISLNLTGSNAYVFGGNEEGLGHSALEIRSEMIVLEAAAAFKRQSFACANDREGGKARFLARNESGDIYAEEIGAVVKKGEGKILLTVFAFEIEVFGNVNNRSNLSCCFARNQS